MSNKHLRRALAEKEEKATVKLESDSESENDVIVKKADKPLINKFALLKFETDESNVEHQNGDPEKIPTMKSNVKKRQNKKKKTKHQTIEDDTDAILEAAVRDAHKYQASDAQETTQDRLLKVDPRNLIPDNELKRLLGKNFGRPEMTRMEKSHRVIAGKIVKVKLEWPPLRHSGLYMELDKEEENGNIKWYRFKHNSDYQIMQQLFWMYMRELDHETILNNLLVENPYHLDALLILAEVTRVQEDFQISRDAVERGLFSCESSFHSSFQLLSQNYLLDYTWRENRAFYLLLLRHLQHMIQRRTFFTALQIAKVIFSKDPIHDPLAMTLIIDSLALKAKEYQWIIDFYQYFKDKKNFDWLPNFLYSIAMANYFLWKENGEKVYQDKAQDALKLALIRFPFILGNILDRMSIKPDSKVDNSYYLSSTSINRETDGLKLLTDIYWKHTEEFWRQPDLLSWLESTVHVILPEFQKAKKEVDEFAKVRQKGFVGMPQNVVRHAICFDVRPSTESDSIVNPVPPKDSKNDYDEVRFDESVANNPMPNGADSNTMLQFLRSILPDDAQESVDAVFEASRERFPAIIAQLVEQIGLGNNNREEVNDNAVSNRSARTGEPSANTARHEQAEEHDQQQASTSQQSLSSANNVTTEERARESSSGEVREKNKDEQ